jgi:dTDP-4-amino-4,6-dideoxygalactose transaminase
MWARTRLKIGWTDLLCGIGYCFTGGDRDRLAAELETYWAPDGTALATYSVRSALDLLLQASGWREGDEIMFSAMNVKGMIKIARREGFVPVPVDLDIAHMAPQPDSLAAAVTPRTRAIVVAHLFGARNDLGPLIEFAHERGIMVIEDCAQAFVGHDFRGHPQSDVCMFSFGPLKTATALCGGIVTVKDKELLQRMREIEAGYPVQPTSNQLGRALKFAALKLITARPVFSAINWGFGLFGRDYEDTISDAVRGVAKLGSSKKLRFRPAAATLKLLLRRLRRWRDDTIAERTRIGERLRDYLGDAVPLPGTANAQHSYWVFPILAKEPLQLIAAMRREGFDAANLPRSQTVAAPEDRPELEPATAAQTLSELVVLPCYPGMPDSELKREAELVRRLTAGRT